MEFLILITLILKRFDFFRFVLILIKNSSKKGFAGGLQSPASVTPIPKTEMPIIANERRE